ncbi:MAG: hypothetical protein IKA84_01105 [Clostridia bacterium]|nr:hypothetical protein [Clostridia bacterium]
MKKKSLLVTIILLLIAVFAFSLTACNNEVGTLETLKNEYGIVVDGGSFEEGSTLVSNEIVATTEEAEEVLAAISEQNYNKDGNVYIFDIYVTKDGAKVQPKGKVTVSIPLPNAEIDNYLVFHIKANNSVENLVPIVDDEKISFETSSFSYFVIAEAAIQDAPPIHVHNFEWVEGKEPTCEEEGIVPHYHCDGCGKNFDPNYGEMESISIQKAEHEYGSMYWGKSANFFEDGNIEYYQCSECEKYFDNEYNEVETPVIPKYSTNLSICVNGTPTALVLGEHNDSFIEWSLEGLSVTKGDVITICQTDNAEISHNYFAEGNVGTDGKIITTAAAANVLLTATPNGLMLFIDGYKYEGIVIEINGVQYPMNYVTYSDEETTGYIYGLVEFAVGDKFVIVDNVSGTVYDYDDLDETYLWNTWDFHRGDNGEFVIDYAARYGVEFDGDVSKKIYIDKHFAPLDGGYYEVVIEGEEQGEPMQGVEAPEGSYIYNEVIWYYNQESVMNAEDIIAYVEEKGLHVYTLTVTLAEGTKINIKMGVDTIITADHLTNVNAQEVCVTKEGDYVKILTDGVYTITYLPAYNAFDIHKTEEVLPDAYIYCDNGFVALTMDANSTVSYEGFVAEANDYVTFFDGTKTEYLSITLDSNTDSTLAHVMTSEGLDMLFFDKAGTYNLAYNIDTGVLSITSVGGDTDQGGDVGGGEDQPTIDDYYIFLSVVDYTNGNQTIRMSKNPENANQVYARVETMAANSFISVGVMVMGGDYATTTYGALSDTPSDIATSLGELIQVYIAGPIDVYFDFDAKTIKVVKTGDLPEQTTILPKDIYISTMEKYAFTENPDNADELCYLGLALGSYDDFRIRDTDNNYISDITLAFGTTGASTSGSAVMVEADGTYNIYINKTTHEVRIVAVS